MLSPLLLRAVSFRARVLFVTAATMLALCTAAHCAAAAPGTALGGPSATAAAAAGKLHSLAHFPGLHRHHEMMEANNAAVNVTAAAHYANTTSSTAATHTASTATHCGYSLPLFAVALISICFGVGESTFFSLLSVHPASSISAFASGTGCAGVVGAGVYYLLIWLSDAPTALLLCALCVPLHAAVFLRVVLPATETARRDLRESDHTRFDDVDRRRRRRTNTDSTIHRSTACAAEEGGLRSAAATAAVTPGEHHATVAATSSGTGALDSMWRSFRIAVRLRRSILKYFLPLLTMYFLTFFINHALLPHVSRRLALGDHAGRGAASGGGGGGGKGGGGGGGAAAAAAAARPRHGTASHLNLLRYAEERYYVLFFFVYQCAVFVFRSSLPYYKVGRTRTLWLLNGVQFGLLVLFFTVANMRHHSLESALADWAKAGVGAAAGALQRGGGGGGRLAAAAATAANAAAVRHGAGFVGSLFTKVFLLACVALVGVVSGIIYVNTFNLVRHGRLVEHAPGFSGERVGASEEESRSIVLGLVVCATTAGPILAAVTGIGVDRFFYS
jgi:hypothetical protein